MTKISLDSPFDPQVVMEDEVAYELTNNRVRNKILTENTSIIYLLGGRNERFWQY